MFAGEQRDLLEVDQAARWVMKATGAALALKHVVQFPEAREVGTGGRELVDQAG